MTFNGNEKRQIRKASREQRPDYKYASFSAVPHNIYFEDDQRIWVENGANYDEYRFERESETTIDGGNWYATGVSRAIALAPATW